MDIFVTSAFALFTIFTIFGFLGRSWWVFKIFDFPRLHYSIFFFVLTTIAGFNGYHFIASASFALSLLNLWRIRHYLIRRKRHVRGEGIKLISINAFKKNHDPEKLKKYLDEEKPDILLVMEMIDCIEGYLQSIIKNYKYKQETYVRDGFRIALFSKLELKNKKITKHGQSDTPLLHSKFEFDGQTHTLFSAHPKPALNAEYASERDEYFHEILPFFQDSKHPIIAIGDFNSVPWEKHFRTFMNDAGIHSALWDISYTITWPTYVPFIGIPMDHVLVSKGVKHGYLERGPYVGSDHYPIKIKLLK